MMRTYLDESSLHFAGTWGQALRDAIDDLVDVTESMRGYDDEVLLRSQDVFEVEVDPGRALLDFLYAPASVEPALRDARQRLGIALDRMRLWEDSTWELDVPDYEVRIGTETVWAPSLAQAIAADRAHGPVATLALGTARAPGPFEASVGDAKATPYAVSAVDDRPRFVRAWLLRNPPQPGALREFTERAFPALEWTDEARAGLRTNSKFFFEDRFETTLAHLAALNDHVARLFTAYSQNDERQRRLEAGHGVNASPESPSTRADKAARAERVVRWRGESIYFWWHTKIRYDTGRIHFHHDTSVPAPGRIVVGLCVKHLKV